MRLHLLFATFAALCLTAATSSQELAWQRSLDSALQLAQDKQRVLLVCVVMPGERDSDALIAHYRDPAIRKLSQQCVCLRIDIGSDRPTQDQQDVLERYLGAAPREPFLVPHHVVVHPDGKTVISSAARAMTAGQLEWFVADGVTRNNKAFSWPRQERSRAPEGLRYGEAEDTRQEATPPPGKKEVAEAIAALKKGGAGWQGSIKHYNVLLRSKESGAIKYVTAQLNGSRGFLAGIALGTIAQVSPIAWAPVLVDFLDNRNATRRQDAARGLYLMAAKKSGKKIKKRLKKESKPEVKAWLLRAAVATAPTDRAVLAAVEKALSAKNEPIVRMHAAVAAGAIESRDTAHKLMRKALADADPDVRSAAAYSMAMRRNDALVGALEAAVRGEGDAEAKHWLETALDTLRNRRDLREFETFRTKVLKERRGIDPNARMPGGRAPGGGGSGGKIVTGE